MNGLTAAVLHDEELGLRHVEVGNRDMGRGGGRTHVRADGIDGIEGELVQPIQNMAGVAPLQNLLVSQSMAGVDDLPKAVVDKAATSRVGFLEGEDQHAARWAHSRQAQVGGQALPVWVASCRSTANIRRPGRHGRLQGELVRNMGIACF
jgi:hypothetical protein